MDKTNKILQGMISHFFITLLKSTNKISTLNSIEIAIVYIIRLKPLKSKTELKQEFKKQRLKL